MARLVRAVRCHRFAGLDDRGRPMAQPIPLREVLTLDRIPAPECGPGQVLVATHYAGVQYPDALQAQGLYQEQPPLPYVPGMDLAGTVIACGAGVERFQPGETVFAQPGTGAMAEEVAVDAGRVWRAPEGVPLAACANLGRNYFPAYHSLKTLGEVDASSLVLVDGASGGVGMAAIQLAKVLGARVIASVGSPEKASHPRSAGADRVLCYGRDREAFKAFKADVKRAAAELGHPAGVDVVVDVVQGELFESLVSSLRPLGRICLVGFTGGQQPIRPGLLLIKQAVVVGSLWQPWAREHPDRHAANVREIVGFLADGTVRPRVDRSFPLDEFRAAFELFEHNRGRGNTVLCVAEERAP